jgi:hypothetical protein
MMHCIFQVQLLAHGQWFSPGILASSTTKAGRHDIAEILLKVETDIIAVISARLIGRTVIQNDNVCEDLEIRNLSVITQKL